MCLKKKHKRAWESLSKALDHRFPEIELFGLENFYPAGDEHILVYEVTRKVVPQGGIPIEVGAIVNNVETLLNVARAVDEGSPVTHRYLTVAGEIRSPMITRVPIGTPIGQILEFAGGPTVDEFAVIIGGPMMGTVAGDLSVPITKTTTALIVLPASHNIIQGKITDPQRMMNITKTVCCQCSRCTDLCPRRLLGHDIEPHKIMRSLAWASDISLEVFGKALFCSECGVCEKYACPMMISPREVNAKIKKELLKKGIKGKQNKKDYIPSGFRELRKIPTGRLMEKLDIEKYDEFPPFKEFTHEVKELSIHLDQHIGRPAVPVVKIGDRVKENDLIADVAQGAIGARLHSPVEGAVVSTQDMVKIKAATMKG